MEDLWETLRLNAPDEDIEITVRTCREPFGKAGLEVGYAVSTPLSAGEWEKDLLCALSRAVESAQRLSWA